MSETRTSRSFRFSSWQGFGAGLRSRIRCVTVEDAALLEDAFKAQYKQWKGVEDARRARQKRINADHARRVKEWENRNDARAKRIRFYRRKDALRNEHRATIRTLKSRLQAETQGAWSTYNDSVNAAMKKIRHDIEFRIETATDAYKQDAQSAEESLAEQMANLRAEADEVGVTI